MDELQHDLFLSHSGADKAWVRQLASEIEQRDCQGRRLKVFLDERDIQPGENWVTALQNALQVSRRVSIILSPEAMQSPWVEAELTAAMNMGLSTHQRRLIPLYLRDCCLPPFLAEIQYIDFRDPMCYAESVERLVSVLCEWPLPSRSALPLPPRPDPSLFVETTDGAQSAPPPLPRPDPSLPPIRPLTPQEQRCCIRDQLKRLSEDQIKGFFYFNLNQRWDDLPGSWKRPKIRGLIQLYDLLGEGEYGLSWLLYQVERYMEELRLDLT